MPNKVCRVRSDNKTEKNLSLMTTRTRLKTHQSKLPDKNTNIVRLKKLGILKNQRYLNKPLNLKNPKEIYKDKKKIPRNSKEL